MPSARSFPNKSLRRLVPAALTAVAVLAAVPSATAAARAATPEPSRGSSGSGGGGPTGAVTAAPDPSVPRPAVPKGLPTQIEAASPYLRQVSCDPTAKPGSVALGRLLSATYPGTSYGVARPCGADGIASEHYEGRAVDWGVDARDPAEAARAASFIDWLLTPDDAGHQFANARRLGVMYLIWNDRIWGSYAGAAGWRAYSSCATHQEPAWDTSCHRDHVHISLSWAGAMGATSFWTGTVAPVDHGPCRPADLNWAAPYTGPNRTPCPARPAVTARPGASSLTATLFRYSGAVVGQGSTGPVVHAVQAVLGIKADGRFGPRTATAVSTFRRAQRLTGGTDVDAPTWRALLKVAAAAGPSPATAGDTAGDTAGRPAEQGREPRASGAKDSPLAKYHKLVLTPGTRGAAVSTVQRALEVTPVSGWYGPVTTAAVRAFQKAHRIPPTGNVGPLTWKALGA